MKIQEINHQHCQKWIIGLLQSQFHFQTVYTEKRAAYFSTEALGDVRHTHMMNCFKVLGKLLPCHVVYCFTNFSCTFLYPKKGENQYWYFFDIWSIVHFNNAMQKTTTTYRNRQYFSLLDCNWAKSYRKSTEQKLVTKIQMLRLKGANCTVIENCWNKSHIGSSTLQGGTKVMVQFASFDWTINFAPPHDGNHICWLPDWCYRLSRQENTHLRVEQ